MTEDRIASGPAAGRRAQPGGAPDPGFHVAPAGDSALIVFFEDRIDPVINARAIHLAESLERAGVTGVRDVVPAYRSVTVYFDPLRTDCHALTQRIEREAARSTGAWHDGREPIEIPVCYGGELGPDLRGVASFAGLSEAEVIARHTAPTYRVFMLGFVPGFAYMGIVDERIAAPRHATPRVRVPHGSVGIAGPQTGVYPTETPGGWQLIGRTPHELFDPGRPEPCLLKAGDGVRFKAIGRAEYDHLSCGAHRP